jgi:hypothetical protein
MSDLLCARRHACNLVGGCFFHATTQVATAQRFAEPIASPENVKGQPSKWPPFTFSASSIRGLAANLAAGID